MIMSIFDRLFKFNDEELQQGIDNAKETIKRIEELAKKLDANEHQFESQYLKLMAIEASVWLCSWAKDIDNKFIFANKKCVVELLGCTVSDEIEFGDTTPFQNAIPYTDAGIYESAAHKLCTASDDIVKSAEKVIRFVEIGDKAWDIVKAPLYGEDGELVGTIGSGVDITPILHPDIFAMKGCFEIPLDTNLLTCDYVALLKGKV